MEQRKSDVSDLRAFNVPISGKPDIGASRMFPTCVIDIGRTREHPSSAKSGSTRTARLFPDFAALHLGYGLVHLFEIESPALTSAMALAEELITSLVL
jgi:hypothetical protein